MTRDDARARVAKGAALLDEKRPGWAQEIHTGKLWMEGDCTCILGQLEGSFWKACTLIGFGYVAIDRSTHRRAATLASEHGFHSGCINFDMMDGESRWYRLLQDAWIEAIADRVVASKDQTEEVGNVFALEGREAQS